MGFRMGPGCWPWRPWSRWSDKGTHVLDVLLGLIWCGDYEQRAWRGNR